MQPTPSGGNCNRQRAPLLVVLKGDKGLRNSRDGNIANARGHEFGDVQRLLEPRAQVAKEARTDIGNLGNVARRQYHTFHIQPPS